MGIHIQQIGQMPGNGFPFTVRVSCQINGFGADILILQVFDEFALIEHIGIGRCKIIFNIDTKLIAWQVAQMSPAGHDLVVTAQESFDSLRLSRRFHNDQIFCIFRQGIHFLQRLLLRQVDRALDDHLFVAALFLTAPAFLFLVVNDDCSFDWKF